MCCGGTVSTLAASYMLRPIINDYINSGKNICRFKETGRGVNRHAGGVFVGRDGSVFTEPHYAGTFSESTGCACAVIYLCIWKSCRYGFLIPIPKEI